MITAVAIAVVATAFLTIIVMNFITGEKKIERRIQPLYGVSDPQFLRSMGTLLGPSIRADNHIDALANGDQIFPAMLEAIRSALLVVDGRIGFTGGVGIADEWLGHAEDENHWRDSHFRLVGPAVGQMQAAFMDNWIKTEGEVLHGEDYFPKESPRTVKRPS